MTGFEWTTFITPEFLFGMFGAVFVTAYLTLGFVSFVEDRMRRKLIRWEKITCAFVSAMLVAIAWDLYNLGAVEWPKMFAETLGFGMSSSFIYENFIRPWISKRKKDVQG